MTDQQDEDALFDRLAKNLEAVRQDAELVRSGGVAGIFAGVARIEVELRSLATAVDGLRQGSAEQRGVTERLEAAAAKRVADLEQLRQIVNALSGRVCAQAEMLDRSSNRKPSGWSVALIGLALVVLVLGDGAVAWTASGREPSISALAQRLVARLSAESAGRPAGPGASAQSARGATGPAGNPATMPPSQAAPAPVVSAQPAATSLSAGTAAATSSTAPSPPAGTAGTAAPPPSAKEAAAPTEPSAADTPTQLAETSAAATASQPSAAVAPTSPTAGATPTQPSGGAIPIQRAATVAAAPPSASAKPSGATPKPASVEAPGAVPASTMAEAPPAATPSVSAETPSGATPSVSAETPTAAVTASQPSQPRQPVRQVVLRAVGSTWVRVRQNGGRVLMTRSMKAGDTWPVPPEPNLILDTGNADGLDLDLDGVATRLTGAEGGVIRDVLLNSDLLGSGAAVRVAR